MVETERERQTERDREISHPLVYSLIAHSSRDWVRLMPGARNFIWVSHVGGQGPKYLSLYHLPRVHMSRKRELTAELGLEPRCSDTGCGRPKRRLPVLWSWFYEPRFILQGTVVE